MSMQAIHIPKGGPPSVLELTTTSIPTLSSPYDILVRLKACALNPIDTKVRQGAFPAPPIAGFDGAGIVAAAGAQARFREGDAVIYAGVLGRAGTNAQYSVVDSRLAARKPDALDWVEAAALPLVGLTAWEMLECHFGLVPGGPPKREETLVIVNGAGGVGSVATQLARKVFKIQNVVVTASRPETVEWVKRNGATHVLNHREDLGPQLKEQGLTPSLAFICYDTPKYIAQLIPTMRAWGKIGSIVESEEPLPIHSMDAFMRALSFHWELMFARGVAGYDLETQGRILERLGELAADGTLSSNVTERQVLSVESLRKMHEMQESGKAIGKLVFEIPEILV